MSTPHFLYGILPYILRPSPAFTSVGPKPPLRANTFADDNQLGTKLCDLASPSRWRTSVKDKCSENVFWSFYFYFGDSHQYCVDIFGNLERKFMGINSLNQGESYSVVFTLDRKQRAICKMSFASASKRVENPFHI